MPLLAPMLCQCGEGHDIMEAAWSQPVLGNHWAKLGYACHYPIPTCPLTDPVEIMALVHTCKQVNPN